MSGTLKAVALTLTVVAAYTLVAWIEQNY